jgi:hypothetical protein
MSIYPFAFSRYEHDFYANDNNEHEIDAALVAHPAPCSSVVVSIIQSVNMAVSGALALISNIVGKNAPNKRMLSDWFSAALQTIRKCRRYVAMDDYGSALGSKIILSILSLILKTVK